MKDNSDIIGNSWHRTPQDARITFSLNSGAKVGAWKKNTEVRWGVFIIEDDGRKTFIPISNVEYISYRTKRE